MARPDREDRTHGNEEPITRDEFNTAIEGLRKMILTLGNQARPDEDKGEDRRNNDIPHDTLVKKIAMRSRRKKFMMIMPNLVTNAKKTIA
ncbi:hypothetical protein L3X38_006204 [Prunus dulcis]|uniref:Uncharacterized protein n=1 Tax=Prunus dulcis TaxID=3755 RepID=A0AAD5F4T2_PRUDU|nr:hypothetical protein L3X38_006204 [Prunus dulcis]